MERLEVLQPLAAADERDRHADDADDRERGAAARVAVHLRQRRRRSTPSGVEFAGALDRVLPGHRVGDVEQIRRLRRVLDRLQLDHQLVVDVQPAGRVDDDDVEACVPRLRQRAAPAAPDPDRPPVVDADAGLLADDGQLLDRRRPTTSVETRIGCFPASSASAPASRRRRLARPLEAQQQDDPRRACDGGSPPCAVAEERQHLVADDADDLLRRRQALQDLLIDRLIPDAVDERLDDLEVDVRLEQRHADLAQRGHRLLGEADLTAQRPEDSLEAVTERVEHRCDQRSTELVRSYQARRAAGTS